MRSFIFYTIFLFSVNLFANDVRFQGGDCHFTRSELQNAFQKFLQPFFKTAGHALKEESLQVEDSSIDPRSVFPFEFGLVKKLQFETVLGESLSLEDYAQGIRDSGSDLTLGAVFLTQGQQLTYDEFGNLIDQKCILSIPYNGIDLVFKNLKTDHSLVDLTQKFRAFVKNNFTEIAIKAVN